MTGVIAAVFGGGFVYLNRDWQPPERVSGNDAAGPQPEHAGTQPPNTVSLLLEKPPPLIPADPSATAIAEYNTLHVLPYGATPDDHVALSDEQLKQQSFNDEVAALVLARRSEDEEEKLNWYLRAAGLSGRPGPILEYAHTGYPDQFASIGGDHALDVMKNRLVLESVAARLSDPRARPDYWRVRIRAEFPNTDLEWLEDKVEDILTHMSIIQRHAKGEGTIQALLD